MEPNDPNLIQQQQHADNLRRQQLEQQRRQQQDIQLRQQREDQDLLELEEDEQELLRRERASGEATQVGSAEVKSASGMAALMGLLRRKRRPVDDPESDEAADAEGDPQDAISSSSGAGGGSGGLWAVGLVVVALAAFAAYRYGNGFFGHPKAPELASTATKPSVDLPLAAPEEGLSSPTGASSAPHPSTPSVLGSAETTAEASPPPSLQSAPAANSPAATPVSAHASPLTDAAAAAAAEATSATTVPPSPELDRLAQGHAKGSEAQDPLSLPLRVQLLEVQLTNLRQDLARLSEENAAKAAPAVQHPQISRSSTRHPGVTRRLARSQARPAIKAATVAPATSGSAPDLQARLLSVDTWDGRPSVVVASGQQTRILQPGDSINGITLKHADPVSGRATFSTGTGQVTLDVDEGKPAR